MSEFPETNHSLIARVQELGDGTSWAEFLRIYQPVVFRMAQRRGMQEADALDVMQQVFLSISRSIQGWTGEEGRPPFRAWLQVIVRNAITKALSRRPLDAASGSSSVMELIRNVPDVDETTAEILVETRREIFRWAAEQVRIEFSDETWAVFWMVSVDGKSAKEVSLETGKSLGAIYVARYRVLARIKQMVQEVSQQLNLIDGGTGK